MISSNIKGGTLWTHSRHTEHVLLLKLKQLAGAKTIVLREFKSSQEV